MNVSKWLKIQALLEADELKELLEDLSLYNVSQVLLKPDASICKSAFFDAYEAYVESVKAQKIPLIDRHLFSAAISAEPPHMQNLGCGRYLAKFEKPPVQIQPHAFIFSEGKCLSMVHGSDSISWGLQFAYPQIAMDEKGNLTKTLRTTANGAIFLKMQKWMRNHTHPASFTTEGKNINTPLRLGKGWSGRLPHD